MSGKTARRKRLAEGISVQARRDQQLFERAVVQTLIDGRQRFQQRRFRRAKILRALAALAVFAALVFSVIGVLRWV